MSLIMIDDDSNEGLTVISDVVSKESSESDETYENESTASDTDTEDSNEVLSNSQSNDTEMPPRVVLTEDSVIDTTENNDEEAKGNFYTYIHTYINHAT